MNRILNDGTTIVLLRDVHPGSEAAEVDSTPASVLGIDHHLKEVPMRVQD